MSQSTYLVAFVWLTIFLGILVLLKSRNEKLYVQDLLAKMKYGYTRIDPRDRVPMGTIQAISSYRSEMSQMNVDIEYHVIEKLIDEEIHRASQSNPLEIPIAPDLDYSDVDSAPNISELLEQRDDWYSQNMEAYTELQELVSNTTLGQGVMAVSTPDDGEISERVEREGGEEGEIQISLAWDDYNDLDLHVYTPSRERIFFNNKKSRCGGELDVDMNVKPESKEPVENIVWKNSPPSGKYKVVVHFYRHHKKDGTTKQSKYRLRVSIKGVVREYVGTIKKRQRMLIVTSFTLK